MPLLEIKTGSRYEREAITPVSFAPDYSAWHLDYFLAEGCVSALGLPLDTCIKGYEADHDLFRFVTTVCAAACELNFETASKLACAEKDDNFELILLSAALKNRHEKENRSVIYFIPENSNRLDTFLPDGFPETWLPVDTALSASGPLNLIRATSNALPFTAPEIACECGKTEKTDMPTIEVEQVSVKTTNVIQNFVSGAWEKPLPRLDTYPSFDYFPADIFPLDLPIGGVYA